MRKLLLLALLAAPLFAQTSNATIQPDCLIPFTLTVAGNAPAATVAGAPNDNRTKGCAAWTLMYQSTTLTGVTVTLQSASTTGTSPSYGSFAGTISTGFVNPIVSDTGGSVQAVNGTADISWVRVNVAATGSGTLTGVLYGFRNSSAAVNGGGGGGGGMCPDGPIDAVQSTDGTDCVGNAAFVANYSALAVPAAPSLVKVGSGTGTTWGYEVVCGILGGLPVALGSVPSTEATISGNATLDGTHSITVTVPASVGGETSCDVYRTTASGTPSTRGLIGNVVNGGSVSDTGLTALFFGPASVDYSVGVASSIPYVNSSLGSCFGSRCQANNDSIFYGGESSTGLAIFTSNTDPGFDYNSFLVSFRVDQGFGGIQSSGIDSLEVNTPTVNGKLIGHEYELNIFQGADGGTINRYDAVIADALLSVQGYSSTITTANMVVARVDADSPSVITNLNLFTSDLATGNTFTVGTFTGLNLPALPVGMPVSTSAIAIHVGDFSAAKEKAIVVDAGTVEFDGDIANPFVLAKTSVAASAPGAGKADLRWLAGTLMGTCKLVSNAGTSATEVTIIDNVGGGC